MAERTEQRICIKFCFNLGISCAETFEMLQKGFKDECMKKKQIKEWYGRFKNGRTSVNSDPRSGRPSTGTLSHNVERARVALEQDRRLTVRKLEDEIRIPKSTVWRILTKNLGMTRVCTKFIPKLLSDQQKNLRLEIAQDNLEMINSDENFLKKIITGDETWVYGYDPETKQQSSQWKFPSEPRPKKARQSRSQTINKEYYVEVLKRLRNAIRRKRPQLWESGDWLTDRRQIMELAPNTLLCLTISKGRVVVYRASTPQVLGSINGLGKVDSAFHPRYIGSINEYQACLGS
ncbi:protein GVQW3 [Trichonephila clavipes]|uniref:Protein GVQW3 n=1 Tax=Trichonephila clavipes TaxID=2585209 RepID=A0A8X6VAI2_TRICX|nr:protein GVQW3 [Trichonephila clavipes]